MSQELNNEFRADPLHFGQRNVLWPGEIANRTVQGLQANTSTSYFQAKNSIAGGQSLFQLKGQKRIWSCDLNRDGSRITLNIRPSAVTAPAMAIYFLPWSEEQVLRTVLRPTRDQALRGAKPAIAANPANPAAAPPQDTNDPDIFFTAAVNGCMVAVEGSREEPVVYHCNAIRTGLSPMDAALTDRNAGEAVNRIGQKVQAMSGRLQTMSAQDPKGTKGAVATAAGRTATTQSDYMLLAHNAIGAGDEAKWQTIRDGIARSIGKGDKLDQRIRVTKSVGTVFGNRAGGRWTFYYQRLVAYEVWKQHGIISREWRRDEGELWWVAECTEFWPHGGHVL